MFTGIITDTTDVKVTKADGSGLFVTFARPEGWKDLELGESVATNGVCLTVASIRDDEYDCHLMSETLSKTAFGASVPERVNLERALKASDRLSGHFVQGHIDEVGHVKKVCSDDGADIWIEYSIGAQPLVVYKGSITINGVSLTVAEVRGNSLKVSLVPYTLRHTTLRLLRAGDPINLEFDIIGKYIHKSIEGVPTYAAGKTS